jgi:hypothetical protein
LSSRLDFLPSVLPFHDYDNIKDVMEPSLPLLALGGFVDAISSVEDPIEKG